MAKKSALRILIVDDEPLIRWSLAETLQGSGHTTLEAGDGETALRLVTDGPLFDLVLLDFRLPDSNDLNLLATIRRLAPWSAVIMMTAHGTPEVIKGALDLGVSRVVTKPFEVGDVTEWVRQATA
jgi:two-component system response regulator AtoC